ncbi:MAG: hypothetical protein JST90_17275 [Bacteroidetes bacterium]|nr:hypothetical protein [Bacteroidota bacterium]
MILVEGESEEISLPILGFRKRFILSQRKIQVYNSKSKQKLKEDFFSLKAKYPSLKIVCILDDDAVTEKNDIERVIEGHKDQYNLVFIPKGTFEDLFDLPSSIVILNELYPEGDEIVLADFDMAKTFLKNIKSILYTKKKATFDKVAFARRMAFQMDIEKLPPEIQAIFDLVKDFTEPTSFVKSKSRSES